MGTRLHAFPSADRAFVAYAEACLAELPGSSRTPAALQRHIRRRYPAAIVSVQEELARHGSRAALWYVFRSGARTEPDAQPAPSGAWPAWAELDDERRFVRVSEPFARIAEERPQDMVGRPIEDFTNPADPTIEEDIARLWAEFRRTGAIASTIRFNFADGRPREIEYRLVADEGGLGMHRLSIRELTTAES